MRRGAVSVDVRRVLAGPGGASRRCRRRYPGIGGSSALRGIHLDPAITPTTSAGTALGWPVMVRLADVIAVLEAAYPSALAQDWDAVGLVCGDPDDKVESVL